MAIKDMKKLISIFFFISVFSVSWASLAAALEIIIDKSTRGEIPITVVPFKIGGGAPHNASKIIESDLQIGRAHV